MNDIKKQRIGGAVSTRSLASRTVLRAHHGSQGVDEKRRVSGKSWSREFATVF